MRHSVSKSLFSLLGPYQELSHDSMAWQVSREIVYERVAMKDINTTIPAILFSFDDFITWTYGRLCTCERNWWKQIDIFHIGILYDIEMFCTQLVRP